MAEFVRCRPTREWVEDLNLLPRDGKLHALLPAGIGDFLWIWCKWHAVAAQREVVFHLPAAEQHRAHQLLELLDPRPEVRFLTGLRTDWVWDQPGDPPLPAGPAWLPVQANRHLEAGRRLEEWYPDLPLRYPAFGEGRRDLFFEPCVLAFLCHQGYMRGNLRPEVWARLLSRVEREAPVRIVAAGNDVPFAAEVRRCMNAGDSSRDLYDRPLAQVVTAMRRAKAMLGLAGGPTILGLMLGLPVFFAYPDHLYPMPGSWEPPGSRWGWCPVTKLPEAIHSGGVVEWLLR